MNNMKQNIPVLGILIALTAVIAAGVFFAAQKADTWMSLREKQLKSEAVDGCMTSSTFVSEVGGKDGKNVTTEPMKNWYELCMKEKGY